MQAKNSFRIWLVVGIVWLTVLFSPISNGTFAMVSNVYDDCNENPELCSDENISKDNSTDAETESTESASVSVGVWDYIKIVLALAFVIGLLLVIIKFLNKRNLAYQQNTIIKNIGGLSIGQQKSVQLLHIGKRIYVVGVGEDIQLIKEIESAEEVEQLLYQIEQGQKMVITQPYITELFKKFSKKDQPKDISNSPKFNDMFSEKLDEIKQQRSDELERWKEQERDNR
ncbi:flagellar biosynthetic protein FliO [Solibacillus sp. MA9]|uniref:Flagellar biosynthetic protein FliO n=1 Tax=Solibacillus palustris TaxID=2908203 RepID=A0ABS9U9E5_9BACL|nr:flagellar biosynthetic protein FliO [Solibacillus sp. MA9]MCH7320946.1 flagellar biosynthetic protein FliO [Solibacillus sp. MA9]